MNFAWLSVVGKILKKFSLAQLVAAAALLGFAVQTGRINGFKVFGLGPTGLIEQRDKAQALADTRGRTLDGIAVKAKQIEQQANHITNGVKDLKNARDDRTDRLAADIVRGGPGRALCSPVVPTGSRGHGQAAPAAGAPLAGLPNQEQFIGLPFSEAVRLAHNHDMLLNEALAWREWYAGQAANASIKDDQTLSLGH